MRAPLCIALLAIPLFMGVGASQPADCGLAGDAADTRGAASPLALPRALCAGVLATGADVDWYSLVVSAGGRLNVVVAGDATLDACLWTPSGVRLGCGQELRVEDPAVGTWKVEIFPYAGGSTYALSAAVRAVDHAGRILLGGDSPVRIDDGLGPGGVDGEWLDLPAAAVAGEWMRAPQGGLSIRFHDAAGDPLGAPCVDMDSDPCPLAAGAVSAFVTRRALLAGPGADAWRIEHAR